MENLQDEEWIYIDHNISSRKFIAAISNRGRYLRGNGEIGILGIRQRVRVCGLLKHVSHLISERFLITVKRPDQVFVDHISHYPENMYVNDVLNLRWCTIKENGNFPEARDNKSRGRKGKCLGENNPKWNPDKEGMKRRRRERMHECARRWREKNPDYLRERRAKRRAAKLNAQQL